MFLLRRSSGVENCRWPVGLLLYFPLPIVWIQTEEETAQDNSGSNSAPKGIGNFGGLWRWFEGWSFDKIRLVKSKNPSRVVPGISKDKGVCERRVMEGNPSLTRTLFSVLLTFTIVLFTLQNFNCRLQNFYILVKIRIFYCFFISFKLNICFFLKFN